MTILLVGPGRVQADEYAIQGHGLVKVGIACMRSGPSHASELVSQCVMGTPLKLLDAENSQWWLVESPEGYRGYMISNTMQRLDQARYDAWRRSERVMYTGVLAGRIETGDGENVSDIYSGAVLEVTGAAAKGMVGVKLPDGRRGFVNKRDIITFDRLDGKKISAEGIIGMARKLRGVAYLWGGTTPAGMDCSGLTKVCFLNQGIILRRDASEQALTGMRLDSDWHRYEPGDLVFFESPATGRIIHVGIYVGEGLYIHSQGMVKVNSLDERSIYYVKSNKLSGASRIIGHIGEEGIERLTRSRAYVLEKE